MFRGCLAGRPYLRVTHEIQLSPFVLTLCIPVMCKAHASLRGMLSRELPARNLLASIVWVFTLSLYHTTLTIKSHNKYRVQKIKYNYNQIWHGIKANIIHICKSQLYILLMFFELTTLLPLLWKHCILIWVNYSYKRQFGLI